MSHFVGPDDVDDADSMEVAPTAKPMVEVLDCAPKADVGPWAGTLIAKSSTDRLEGLRYIIHNTYIVCTFFKCWSSCTGGVQICPTGPVMSLKHIL